LSFEAKHLAIKLFSDGRHDGLLACGACDSTGTPKPACAPPSKPCPAPSKPVCPAPSKKAGATGEGDVRLAGLVALRQQLHSALSQAG